MGCVGTGLAASLDITIQSRTEKLLEGIVPNVGWLTVVVGGLILGIPGGFAWLALRVWSMPTWFGILAILAISMSLDYLLFILLRSFLRKTSTFQSK
jgi:tetrahydromethanopterin S-methyltransferase subunit D